MNAVDVLFYGHKTVLDALAKVDESKCTTGGACGRWSIKDIMAHLASYEHLLIEVCNSFLDGGPTPYLTEMGQLGDQFNDVQVDRRSHQGYHETVLEYITLCDQSLELAKQISPETMRQIGTLPWYGPSYALDDFIVYTFYGHKREHSAQIAAFQDSVGES